MSENLSVPPEVPVMTLPDAVLFPHVMMPLQIYEPRYREMLADVLENQCLFAVARLDQSLAYQTDQFDPPCETATVGVVRACHENPDGTSNLILQGLSRIRVNKIVQENPYRLISITPLPSRGCPSERELAGLRKVVIRLLESKRDLGVGVPEEILQFLRSTGEAEAFIDFASYTLCVNTEVKQKLLETLDTVDRYQIFVKQLENELDEIKIDLKLRGTMTEDDISLN